MVRVHSEMGRNGSAVRRTVPDLFRLKSDDVRTLPEDLRKAPENVRNVPE